MVLLVFLMLLGQGGSTRAADTKAIDELHRKDTAATKAYDVTTLATLWTDDIISMPPNGEPIVGKKANEDNLRAGEEQAKQFDIVSYVQKWDELTLAGEYAFERGTFHSMIVSKTNAQTMKAEFKVLRILKRQADGSWKIHRTIWNEIPPAPPKIIEAIPNTNSAAPKKP